MNRLPFPKYLNRPRLILMFEEDQVVFVLANLILMFTILMILGVTFIPMVIVEFMVFFISVYVWNKIFKDHASGHLSHLLYNLGIKNPPNNDGKESIVPYGFERYFID